MWYLINAIADKIIPNKEIKTKIRNFIFPKNKIKPMKLGVSYSVWDGEELLEYSIKSIRNQCEYINVVWQKKSWFGEPCNETLEPVLANLKEKGLIDELILFVPDTTLSAQQNELNKRNLGLEYVKKANCSHFLTMDADEFYEEKEFKKAKDFITKYKITHSICNLYSYSHINCRESHFLQMFVPFIHKINKKSKLELDACSPCPWVVDPTRQIPLSFFYKICVMSNIVMHHYSGVRKDIAKKYRNSSATLDETKQKAFLEWQKEDIYKKISTGKGVWVDNIFNINID